MRRAIPSLLSLLLVLSGFCTNLCATQRLLDLQHACCPHHQKHSQDEPSTGDKSCDHAAAGQESQAVADHDSPYAASAVLPRPVRTFAHLSTLSTLATPSAAIDTSPQRHFVLRL